MISTLRGLGVAIKVPTGMTRGDTGSSRSDTTTPVYRGVIGAPTPQATTTPNQTVQGSNPSLEPKYALPGVPTPTIGNGPGQCPLVNGLPDPLVRECDAYTGVLHYQQSTPSGPAANANILNYDALTGKWSYLGPNGTVIATGVKPVYNAAASITAPPTNAPVTAVTDTSTPYAKMVQTVNASLAANPQIPLTPSGTETIQIKVPTNIPSSNVMPVQETANGGTTVTPGSNTTGGQTTTTVTKRHHKKTAATVTTPNAATTNSVNTPALFGPGISYNDINPDGTAVQSSPTGLLTDMFSALDQGVSIGGVNVPLWLLVAGGIGAVWAFGKGKTYIGSKRGRYSE